MYSLQQKCIDNTMIIMTTICLQKYNIAAFYKYSALPRNLKLSLCKFLYRKCKHLLLNARRTLILGV